MRDLDNMRNLDLETCLGDCRQRQYPFTFWDETEVGLFKLSDLPFLTKEPRDWKLEGKPYTVDLNHPKALQALKATILKYVIGVEGGDNEVAFAITRTENSTIHIQVYFQ